MYFGFRRLRGSLAAMAASLALVLTLPMTALAGGSVNCGSYSRMYTNGYATGPEQYHWVASIGESPNLGSGSKQRYWGYQTGIQYWDVYGIGITSESANCFIQ